MSATAADNPPVPARRIYARISLFGVSLLLAAFLSPYPDSPGSGKTAFLSMYSTLTGPPSIVIWKTGYSLTLYRGATPIKTYASVFGRGYADGDKAQEGDRRTPEGEFYICSMNHSKRFYKFMGLSYPGLKHAQAGLQNGLISLPEYYSIARAIQERRQPSWDTRLGGAIGIHGRLLLDTEQAPSLENWTDGCIALSNADVDELFSILSVGTPVTIIP